MAGNPLTLDLIGSEEMSLSSDVLLCTEGPSRAPLWTAFPSTPRSPWTLYLAPNSRSKPCAGQRRHEDKLDGYTFDFPDTWIPVTVHLKPYMLPNCKTDTGALAHRTGQLGKL